MAYQSLHSERRPADRQRTPRHWPSWWPNILAFEVDLTNMKWDLDTIAKLENSTWQNKWASSIPHRGSQNISLIFRRPFVAYINELNDTADSFHLYAYTLKYVTKVATSTAIAWRRRTKASFRDAVQLIARKLQGTGQTQNYTHPWTLARVMPDQ
jgi:hypothetical protein